MRILIIALLCAQLHGCGGRGESPEDELRQWVADAQAAAENEQHGALMNMLADNYTDARGNEKKAVDQMLRFYFLRTDSVVLISKIEDVVINGETAAIVKLIVGMAGSNAAAAGFSADAYRFELELEHDGDDWFLIAARWGELGQKML